MFELKLAIGGVEDIYQSASMQTLVREVVDYFASKNPDACPLPFSCKVNGKGQIVEMVLENVPGDSWWDENHPVRSKNDLKVHAVIRKQVALDAEESFPVPDDLFSGDGNCWAAVKDKVVVDLVYMRVGKSVDFSAHRSAAIDRLKEKGKIISGMVTAKKFFPKNARSKDAQDK